jgi:hypothetical protein
MSKLSSWMMRVRVIFWYNLTRLIPDLRFPEYAANSVLNGGFFILLILEIIQRLSL